MNVSIRRLVLLIAAASWPAGQADAQPESVVHILDIRRDPSDFSGRVVQIEGEVAQYRSASGDTTFFLVLGDYGGLIAVRTGSIRPAIRQRLRVRGTVRLDERNIPWVNAEVLAPLTPESTTPASTSPEPVRNDPASGNTESAEQMVIYVLLGSLVSVLFLFAGVVIYMLRSGRSDPGTSGAPRQAMERRPLTSFETEAGHAHLTETVRALPGRFSVVRGVDRFTDVRFFRRPDAATAEITFGRRPGPPYSHILLESPTVSRTQARMRFSGDRYTLFNVSGTNPTRVNDRELERHEAVVLEDGDTIEMGEVVFRFHDV